MIQAKKSVSGITVIEILVAFTVIAILAGIGVSAFLDARQTSAHTSLTDSIVAMLEEAKTTAMSGKNGKDFGVAFSTNSYVYFSGNIYNPTEPSNRVIDISENFQLANTIPGNAIVFTRLSGTPMATGSITVSSPSSSAVHVVTVGNEGDIRVIK